MKTRYEVIEHSVSGFLTKEDAEAALDAELSSWPQDIWEVRDDYVEYRRYGWSFYYTVARIVPNVEDL